MTAEAGLSTLKDFQQDTVNYVLQRLYDDPDATDRFLVADEVGMGKTLVARGVIAGAIERLQGNDDIDRIDIIYICSNADIARQNISKLWVGDSEAQALSTRLTLLATQLKNLNRADPSGRKTINLVAFTPGTSFDQGNSRGRAEERALLWWLLRHVLDVPSRPRREGNALFRLLRMGINENRWKYETSRLDEVGCEPAPDVVREFNKRARNHPAVRRLEGLIDETSAQNSRPLTLPQRRELNAIVGQLRHLLARAGVESLEPDLVILDEFQRFKHLMERPDNDEDAGEVNRLAHDLFTVDTAKVLLLSATPYRMFTLAEERSSSGDDHYADFLATIDFLQYPKHLDTLPSLRVALAEFRTRVVSGDRPASAKASVENLLKRVMCRTERPVSGINDMLRERIDRAPAPTALDLVGFAAMRRIADEVGGTLSIEYWKSAPYFLNFMDGYQLSQRFKDHKVDGDRKALLKGAQVLHREDLEGGAEIDPGNARLRALQDDTIGRGLWNLLWLPPSMPYYEGDGPFACLDSSITKRLIFSSWAAAPTAIASLLSRSALHHIHRGHLDDGPTRGRLNYRMEGDRPGGMTTLALFVPVPTLARLTDPLTAARAQPTSVVSSAALVEATELILERHLRPVGGTAADANRDSWYWAAPLQFADGDAQFAGLAEAMTDADSVDDGGLVQHLRAADVAGSTASELGARPDDLERWVALIGLAGPGNVAWRAVGRVTSEIHGITDKGREAAAVVIAAGFRSLFNRPESMALLDNHHARRDQAYWQTVLEYCLAGNLQAVLDEYLHHVVGNENPTDDESLMVLAAKVRSVIGLRTGALQAFNAAAPSKSLSFPTRFALRYGSARGTLQAADQAIERMGDVQAAFNSPFWPMVLASTSIGQEGVDFHWWCHSLVHWNLPSNPVDFEQREGRVHRFKGHAVRKNVAAAHRADALASRNADPWVAAFEAAGEKRPTEMNDLWPWWVFPGTAKIERWVPSMPLSKELDRELKLQRQRALYRLAFGQPRQEDLVAILEQQNRDPAELAALRIDLRPPGENS